MKRLCTNVMYLICLAILLKTLPPSHASQEIQEERRAPTTYAIGETLLSILYPNRNETNTTNRLPELREKLSRIESYVIDKDQYIQLLLNQTRHNELKETNFYNALQEPDNFLTRNDTKNIYLKMKEKMNRDDIMGILANRGETRVKLSARRMMDDSYKISRRREMKLNEVVDKYLSEPPHDDHKFYENNTGLRVWDPQLELEERRDYYQPDGRRIFKGERTTIRYYPFMVSIHVMTRFWCGGALYSMDLVITSASCLQLMHNNRFFRENPRALSVRVGSNHSRIGGELIDALEVYFYPAYNPRTLRNNIAIVRLIRSLKLTYHRVPVKIPLYKNEGGMASTAEVLVLGWGVTKTSQKLAYEPIFLQRKILPVYPNIFCKEVYGKKFLADTMFCAGTLSTGDGACDHDAGGPAVLDGYLAGIISYGPSVCGFPDAPTVFTLIGAYVDWIETIESKIPPIYTARKRTTTTTVDPFVEYFQTSTFNPLNLLTVPPESKPAQRKHKKKAKIEQLHAEKENESEKDQSPEKIKDKPKEKEEVKREGSKKPEKTTKSVKVNKYVGRDRFDLHSSFKVTPRGTDEGKEEGMFIDFKSRKDYPKGKQENENEESNKNKT